MHVYLSTGKLLRDSLGSGPWREIKNCFVNMSKLDSMKHKKTQFIKQKKKNHYLACKN